MVRDLIDQRGLSGKGRVEVHSLLGEPTSLSADRLTYYYWTGKGGLIDDMWLEVTFQEESVASVRHRPD